MAMLQIGESILKQLMSSLRRLRGGADNAPIERRYFCLKRAANRR